MKSEILGPLAQRTIPRLPWIEMARSKVWRPLHRSDLDVGRGETFTDGEKQQSVDLIAREAKTLHDHPRMELKPEQQNLQRTTSRTYTLRQRLPQWRKRWTRRNNPSWGFSQSRRGREEMEVEDDEH